MSALFPDNYQVVLLPIKALVVETPRSHYDEGLLNQLAEVIIEDGGIAEVIHVTHTRKLDDEGNLIYTVVDKEAIAYAAKIANERSPRLEHIYAMVVPQKSKQTEILDALNGNSNPSNPDAERFTALKAEMAAILQKY